MRKIHAPAGQARCELLMMRARDFLGLLKSSARAWIDDEALRLSASLAYYAVFSLAPLLVLVVSAASLIFGEKAARGQISEELEALAGSRAAEALEALLATAATHKTTGVFAAVAGVVALFFGASGVFLELKNALNTIWGVVVKPGRTVRRLIRDRLMTFSMVLSIGFLLLVSLLLSAALAALGKFMSWLLPLPAGLWEVLDFLISFGVITVLFALILKILPNARIRWRDLWIGATLISLLFTIGKFGIGFYLGTSSTVSAYGAAASVLIILLWVYYSACILFFGAEFTKLYACRFGSGINPDERAMWWSEAARARLESEKDQKNCN
jgi:membrane protein